MATSAPVNALTPQEQAVLVPIQDLFDGIAKRNNESIVPASNCDDIVSFHCPFCLLLSASCMGVSFATASEHFLAPGQLSATRFC
jgi:hypothetical protein